MISKLLRLLRPCRIFQNQGFSLIELSIATGIVMISLVAAGNIVHLIFNSNSQMDLLSKQTVVKGNFIGKLLTESNWKSTYADLRNKDVAHGKMKCLYEHTDCAALIGQPTTFRVVDSKLNIAYDASASDGTTPNGFTQTAATCTSFGKASDNCPYHYDLTWEPICKVGACIDPLIKIHGQFSVNFATSVVGRSNSTDFAPMNFDLIMNMKPKTNLYAYPVTLYVSWNTLPGPYTPFSFSIPRGPIANAEGAIVVDKVIKGDPSSVATLSGTNTIAYTPTLKYYGMDFIDYEFHDEIGNTGKRRAWMKVVTPYTWIGDGSDKKASNKMNWCGSVTPDGVCRNDFDPTAPNGAGVYPHFVFNTNCNVCGDIILDIPIVDAIEISPTFYGKIVQSTNVKIESKSAGWMSTDPYDKNYAHQGFYQGGGTFSTNGFNLMNQTDYALAWPDHNAPPPAINFYLQAGTFLASAGSSVTAYNSGFQIDAGVTFKNDGQLIIQKDWANLGYIAAAPGYDLGNLKIDTHGSGGPNHIGSDLNVTSLNLDGSGNVEGGVCGHVTDGSGKANIFLNVSGPINAVGIGGNTYYCDNKSTLIIQMTGVGPQPQMVTGSNDASIPGVIANLQTSATNTAKFTGQLGLQGNTFLQGPTSFDVGSRVNLFWGTLNANPLYPPHFYDSGALGGDWYNINTPVYVDHDFTFDRCQVRFGDGDGCSGFHVGTTDVNVNKIYLKGDLLMISGIMDLSSVEMVVVDFVGTGDQSIIGKNLTEKVSLPSIAVHKPSGKFSITQDPGALGLHFMGTLDIVTSGSVPTFTVPQIYLGNSQMYGSRKFTSYLPMDFGNADIAMLNEGGVYDLGNQKLMAGSLSQRYAYNGAGAVVQISGDVSIPTSQSGNAVLEFVGGSANHHYTGVLTETTPWGPWQKHDILIDSGDKVIMSAPVYDVGKISLLGAGVLDQNSQLIKNVNIFGPATSFWITGGATPQNYVGGDASGFLGTYQ